MATIEQVQDVEFEILQFLHDFCEENGLTMQGNMRNIKNPRGYALAFREKAEFLHYPLKKKMKLWYSYYCDMTFCEEQYRLTKKQCAEYIGAPLIMIYGAAAAHKIWTIIKGKRK